MKINTDIIKNIGKDKLILIVIAGVILVLCTVWEKSGESEKEDGDNSLVMADTEEYMDMDEYVKAQEKKLKEILCRIEGAGEIHVMITIKNGAEKNVFTEKNISYEDTSEDDGTGGKRKIYTYSEDNRTVYMTDENGKTTPYVLSQMAPVIEGVAVISEGGDNIMVKEKIINVIKALFAIDINKISVTK